MNWKEKELIGLSNLQGFNVAASSVLKTLSIIPGTQCQLICRAPS